MCKARRVGGQRVEMWSLDHRVAVATRILPMVIGHK
jgi:hypothetical protein